MSEMRFKAQRGMEDVLPGEIRRWQMLESAFADVVGMWGYEEIRTPILEDYELFVRTSGETSEVVNKQMYDFMDKGERHVALRPEGTAGVMRACLEGRLLQQGQPTRLWYFNQHFRYERPGKGRLRQHHQLGLELIGSPSPLADAEVIEVLHAFLRKVWLTKVNILINSIGRAETRQRFREALIKHLGPWLADQTEEGRAKALANPLRLFDSKDDSIQAVMADAPLVLDYLEEGSQKAFEALQDRLTEAEIPFEVDPRIVRGLDYYTDTVFEIQSSGLGSQTSVCGGGRYDRLISDLDGPPTPSVGAGIGVERILLVMRSLGIEEPLPPLTVFLAASAGRPKAEAMSLAAKLRKAGIRAICDLEGQAFKKQFKQADRLKADWVLTIGDEEVEQGRVMVKNMASGVQESLTSSEAFEKMTYEGLNTFARQIGREYKE
jgi:histidyl-tRNA synthetase